MVQHHRTDATGRILDPPTWEFLWRNVIKFSNYIRVSKAISCAMAVYFYGLLALVYSYTMLLVGANLWH